MKTTLLASIIILLSGCSTMSVFTDKAGEVNDEALNSAEFIICHGSSVGSIRRHYGTPERSAVWVQLCNGVDDFNPEK